MIFAIDLLEMSQILLELLASLSLAVDLIGLQQLRLFLFAFFKPVSSSRPRIVDLGLRIVLLLIQLIVELHAGYAVQFLLLLPSLLCLVFALHLLQEELSNRV